MIVTKDRQEGETRGLCFSFGADRLAWSQYDHIRCDAARHVTGTSTLQVADRIAPWTAGIRSKLLIFMVIVDFNGSVELVERACRVD